MQKFKDGEKKKKKRKWETKLREFSADHRHGSNLNAAKKLNSWQNYSRRFWKKTQTFKTNFMGEKKKKTPAK